MKNMLGYARISTLRAHVSRGMHFCLIFVCALFLSSCGPRVTVSSNSFADRQALPGGFPAGSSFFIETPETSEGNLFAKEVAHKVAVMLRSKGYVVTKNIEVADYSLACTVGVKSFKEAELVSRFVPAQVKTKERKVADILGKWKDAVQETTTLGKYVDVQEEITVFKKSFSVTVCDAKAPGEKGASEPVWSTTVTSKNRESDLRDEFDYLLFSTFAYFGKNTNKKICADVRAKDVKAIRKLYA